MPVWICGSLRVLVAILVIVAAAFVGLSAVQDDAVLGYCAPYPSPANLSREAALCAPYVADYADDAVFFYPNLSVSRDTQQWQYVHNAGLLANFSDAITSEACRESIFPFVCQNLFARCLEFPNATNARYNTSFYLLVREPTCYEVCMQVHEACATLFSNPFIVQRLRDIPDMAPFTDCNYTDPNNANLPTFPAAPGWSSVYGQAVSCKNELAEPSGDLPTPAPLQAPSSVPPGSPPGAVGAAPVVTYSVSLLVAVAALLV